MEGSISAHDGDSLMACVKDISSDVKWHAINGLHFMTTEQQNSL